MLSHYLNPQNYVSWTISLRRDKIIRRVANMVYFGCSGQSPLHLAFEMNLCEQSMLQAWPQPAGPAKSLGAASRNEDYCSCEATNCLVIMHEHGSEVHVPGACPYAHPKKVTLGKASLKINIGTNAWQSVASSSTQTTNTSSMKNQNKVAGYVLEGEYLGHSFLEHKSPWAKHSC